MDWKINDRFRLSGIANLGTHSPRVRTTGTILKLLHNKKAKTLLDEIENEVNIEAEIKLRDIKPVIKENNQND